MRETTEYFRQHVREALDVARLQWKSFTVSLSVVLGMYYMSVMMNPGWGSYAALLPGCLLITAVAFVRCNAIGPQHMGVVWQIRRMGLVALGIAGVAIASGPFLEVPVFPTWRAVVMVNGVAFVLVTTPFQPPFWKYWDGSYKDDPLPRSPLTRTLIKLHGDRIRSPGTEQ